MEPQPGVGVLLPAVEGSAGGGHKRIKRHNKFRFGIAAAVSQFNTDFSIGVLCKAAVRRAHYMHFAK